MSSIRMNLNTSICMKNNFLKTLLSFLTVFFCLFFGKTFAQSGMIEFGQNRVQYRQFDWQFYETDNFNVYFYQGGQDIGKYVILSSEKALKEVIEKLDFRLTNRLDIIVYNHISDLNQTNIGINLDKDNVSGSLDLINNTLFIHFNGNHSEMDKQIKEGITKIYLNKLSSGSGIQEILQNMVMLNIPDWFYYGLIAYAGEPWNTELDNKLRDGISSGKFSDLRKISTEEKIFVGQSLFNYIETVYGENAVSNVLYLTKINKSIDRAFMFVAGKELNEMLEEWYYYHLEKYKKEKENTQSHLTDNAIPIKQKKKLEYYQAKLNPDGNSLLYAQNNQGKWKVKLYNIETKKTKTLAKGGFKTNTLFTDLSIPLLEWDSRGRKIGIISEKRTVIYLTEFETETLKKEKPMAMRNFQKVYGFSYEDNNKNMVIAGMQKGQPDLFRYFIPTTKTTNLTNDFYDYLQPSYVELDDRKGALIISNRKDTELINQRLDTILPNGTFDVFFYDFNSETEPLVRITNTPLANESYPMPFGNNKFTYLSDFNGVNNRYIGTLQSALDVTKKKYFYYTNENPEKLDSVVLLPEIVLDSALSFNETLKAIAKTEDVPVYKTIGKADAATNYYRGLTAMHNMSGSKFLLESSVIKNTKKFIKLSASESDTQASDLETTFFMSSKVSAFLEKEKEKKVVVSPIASKIEDTDSTNIAQNYTYQSKFDEWENISEGHKNALFNNFNIEEESGDGFRFSRTRQYFLKFKTEELAAGFDNSLMVTQYQPFNPGNPVFNQPGLNAMIRFGITDLFEDHKIHGGFRLPIGFGGNELYVTYQSLKKRWDKSLTFYRRAEKQDINFDVDGLNVLIPGKLNTRTSLVEGQFSYALDVINSLRFKTGFRNDRFIAKSTDFVTLNIPNSSQNWIYSRVEFVHDNTVQKALNIRNGFRINVHYEIQKEVPTKEDSLFNRFRAQLPEINNSYLMLWGFDARHYQKVYKNIIWANRIAYNTSVGTRKMIYYLGGTDNLLLPKFNDQTPVNVNNNYAYQTLAYNMRGFQQNIRNGNSYVVFNSELRIPVFATFSQSTVKSQLLQNFQIVGFVDAGTAWEGFTPFSNDNPLFQETISNSGGSAVVRLEVQKQPIVFSYGFGARTTIMGYYIRTDIGWGYDTGTVNKPRFQLSLGYDF